MPKDIGQENQFFLVSKAQTISFLFHEGHDRPYAVLKRGRMEDLDKEYQSHREAYSLFPEHVPAILFYEHDGEMASLCMEYVHESHMTDVVASGWFRRKEKFVEETEHMFAFLLLLIETYVRESFGQRQAVDQTELDSIVKTVATRFGSRGEFGQIRGYIYNAIGIKFPRIMQHGDFCGRNVLYAGKTRKVVIDWEDSKKDHLPFLDFNMLLISIMLLYRELFKKTDEDFFRDEALQRIICDTKRFLIKKLGICESDCRYISLLSTLFLCAQNIKKDRSKTADQIFGFLIRQFDSQDRAN